MPDPTGPAYTLTTPRLTLRCWDPGDAAALTEAVTASREHLLPWMPWARDEPLSPGDRVGFLRRSRGRFDLEVDFTYGVFETATGRVLGGTGLHPRVGDGALEIGYWIRPDACGKGFATELVLGLTKAAFEVYRVARVEVRMDPANGPSVRVAEKAGFTHEATRVAIDRSVDGRPRDTMIWVMHRGGYGGSAAAGSALTAADCRGEALL